MCLVSSMEGLLLLSFPNDPSCLPLAPLALLDACSCGGLKVSSAPYPNERQAILYPIHSSIGGKLAGFETSGESRSRSSSSGWYCSPIVEDTGFLGGVV